MSKKLILLIGTITSMLFMPELLAEAESIDDQIGSWTDTLTSAGGLFNVAVGFGGAIFAFMGIIGLKKYADDNRQNPLMKPLIMFFAGALALGFSGLTGKLATSGTGGEDGSEKVFTE